MIQRKYKINKKSNSFLSQLSKTFITFFLLPEDGNRKGLRDFPKCITWFYIGEHWRIKRH